VEGNNIAMDLKESW